MVHRLGLREVETISRRLERRDATPNPEFEATAAHLVEHADLLDQAQRVIERQEIYHRTKTQPAGALRQGRQEQAGRCGTADRGAVVLGKMISVETRAVESLRKPEPVGVKFAMRHARIVHVVEHAEFHDRLSPTIRVFGSGGGSRACCQ